MLRSNAKGPAGLIDGKATGKPRKLNNAQRRALARIAESGPIPAIHGVVRWRRKDLAFWIFEEFRITLNETTVGRELVEITKWIVHRGRLRNRPTRLKPISFHTAYRCA